MSTNKIEELQKQIEKLKNENQQLKEKLDNGFFVTEQQIEEFAQSQELLNETNKIARVGGWGLNLNTNKLFYTNEIYNIIESDEHFVPSLEKAFTFYIPEHKTILAEAIEKSIQEQKSFDLELQIITAKNTPKWINVSAKAISDNKGNTIKITGTFQDVNEEVLKRQKMDLIIQSSERFIQSIKGDISFDEITNTMREISDAEIASFNLFKPYNREFETVALSVRTPEKAPELAHSMQKSILNRVWARDAFSEEKTKNNICTRFESIHEIADHVLPHETLSQIEDTFELGRVYIVKIEKNNKTIGHFTLLYTKNIKPNIKLAEIYANLAGLYLEKKQAGENLILSEQKHKQMIAGIWDVIAVVGLRGICSYVTQNITDHFGWPVNKIKNKFVMDFVHPDDRMELKNHFSKMLRREVTSKLLDLRFLHHDGSYHNIEISATNHMKNPVINGILINFHDITKRRYAEQQQRKLEQAVKHSSISIVITDFNGIIEYVNPRLCETTGYTEEELIGQNPRILQSGKTESKTYKELWDTILSGKEWSGILLNEKKTETLYWEKTSISSITNKKGKITHFVGIKEDITEQIKREKEIRQTNKKLKKTNAEKDRFFSIIAHDLRSPFNTFMGITSLIANEMHSLDEDQLHGLTQSLDRSAHNMYDLLSNLLDWSMIQQGSGEFSPEPVNLSKKIENARESLIETANKKNVEISNEAPKNITVNTDQYMLETILRNLISNAIKFSHPGGKIIVAAKLSKTINNMINVSVADNGIGMSKSIQRNLFKISKSVKREGTQNEPSSGLGLILCKDFVKKHGGKIWVESDPDGKSGGKGSTFYFTIPPKKKQ
jgi:PAS domain S-box-containing protein